MSLKKKLLEYSYNRKLSHIPSALSMLDYVDEFIICESNKSQSGIPIEYELNKTIEKNYLEKESKKIENIIKNNKFKILFNIFQVLNHFVVISLLLLYFPSILYIGCNGSLICFLL